MPDARENLAVRVTDRGADRFVLVGKTESGKSFLAGILINWFFQDFVHHIVKGMESDGRILIIDSKPAWQAQYDLYEHAYRSVDPVVPHSFCATTFEQYVEMMVPGPEQKPFVLLQNHDRTEEEFIFIANQCMEHFFRTQVPETPSLLYLDESMDFYGPTGQGKGGNIIQRCFRAGRQKGLATMIATQRARTINLQCLSEASVVIAFYLPNSSDWERLYEIGVPGNVPCPPELDPTPGAPDDQPSYMFVLRRKGRLVYPYFVDGEPYYGRVQIVSSKDAGGSPAAVADAT